MSKTNSLTSHHPERRSHRVDKMSGMDRKWKKEMKNRNRSKILEAIKKMASKKRRQYLSNPRNYD